MALHRSRLLALEAELGSATARLRESLANLESAKIVAPRDGYVVRRLAQVGTAIEAGQPAIAVLFKGEYWVEALFEESALIGINPGDVARITLPALPNQTFSGVVDSVGLTSDVRTPNGDQLESPRPRISQTTKLGVRVRFDQTPDVIQPGLSAQVVIDAGP